MATTKLWLSKAGRRSCSGLTDAPRGLHLAAAARPRNPEGWHSARPPAHRGQSPADGRGRTGGGLTLAQWHSPSTAKAREPAAIGQANGKPQGLRVPRRSTTGGLNANPRRSSGGYQTQGRGDQVKPTARQRIPGAEASRRRGGRFHPHASLADRGRGWDCRRPKSF